MNVTEPSDLSEQQRSMAAVSNALVALHKEQFGRGPTKARSNFAGPNTLVCVLEDALLPAERKLVALGQQTSVRTNRGAFQAATADVFENYQSEPLAADDDAQ